MGLFDKIFGRAPAPTGRPEGRFETLTAYAPVWQPWNGRLYDSQIFRAAVDAVARHAAKLEVSVEGSAKPELQTQLKAGPNAFQTWSQFLYRVATILEVENTAFICPVLDGYDRMTGYVPVCPQHWELVQYGGEPWLRFEFSDNKVAAMELRRVGIMTKYQYRSELFGETNAALSPTMELITIQNQGITEAVKNSATYRFMGQANNFAFPEDLAALRENFTELNLRKGGGVLLFPNTWTNIKQIDTKPYVVDSDQMGAIENDIYDYVGVNKDVLQSKATGQALDALFNGKIEPFAIQLAEVLTKMTFSIRERAYGARIKVTSDRLQYMSMGNKLNFVTAMWDRGAITVNEGRKMLNLEPLPDEVGNKVPVRGEYYDSAETSAGLITQDTEEEAE